MAAGATSRRIVVRPPNWLGDAVLALPAIAAVRRACAGDTLTIAAPSSIAALFREVSEAAPDEVLDLPSGSRGVVHALRAGRFDRAVLFPNSFRSAWQVWRSGVPDRWGYATAGRGLLLTRRARPDARRRRGHQADYYRELAARLDVGPAEGLPRLRPGEGSRARAAVLLEKVADRPLVGLAPGAAYGEAKQWPPERLAAVAARLIDAHDVAVVVVGAGHDRDAARAIESWLRVHAPQAFGRFLDLTGRTTVGTLIGVLARMSALISNDSGAMHVAAALDRPVIAMFGPTDERRTRPLGDHTVLTAPAFCRPCLLRDCPIDHRCMKRITVDAVYDAVAARLAAAG